MGSTFPECLSVLRNRRSLLGVAVLFLLWGGCSASDDKGPHGAGGDGGPGYSYPACSVDEGAVEQIVAQLTLEDKIAQMYIIGVSMLCWDVDKTLAMIRDLPVGGVFLQPITGIALSPPEGTAANTNALQEAALSREIPIPLFIAADQEGGIPQALSRLTGGTDQPGNMGLGATFDPNCTYRSYEIMGEQLSAVGINTTFSPVLGLMPSYKESSMYTRCFGELSRDVTRHAGQAVRGLQENLVAATAKHFPSHSTAPGDEHFILPVNEDDEETVRSLYFPPFIEAIRAGADVFMTTHAVFTAFEDGLPSTYSHRIFTDILRGELGYKGLIVTDDMNMGSITLTEVDEHPDVLAIRAGADLILDVAADGEPAFGIAPGNLQWAYDVRGQIQAVMKAVEEGRLSEERIDTSVRRILRTKMKNCLFSDPYVNPEEVPERVNTPEQIQASRTLHAQAFTLVRNDEGLWPLDENDGIHVHVLCAQALLSQMYPDAAWPTIAGIDLLKAIRRTDSNARISGKAFDVNPAPKRIRELTASARNSDADVLVIGTYNALYYEGQQTLVRDLLALDMPTILMVLGMPYDLMAFPEATTCLVTYSNRDLALEEAARALFGNVEPRGRLPVSLPGLYDVGWRAGG